MVFPPVSHSCNNYASSHCQLLAIILRSESALTNYSYGKEKSFHLPVYFVFTCSSGTSEHKLVTLVKLRKGELRKCVFLRRLFWNLRIWTSPSTKMKWADVIFLSCDIQQTTLCKLQHPVRLYAAYTPVYTSVRVLASSRFMSRPVMLHIQCATSPLNLLGIVV